MLHFDCVSFCGYRYDCFLVAHFGGREDHPEVWDLCFCSSVHLFELIFEESVKLHLGLLWCVEARIEVSHESNLGCIPGVFVPWMFIEVAEIVP
jgi:hypothetical protein